MSGDSSRRRDKRLVPFEDIEGEEAFNIAIRQIAPKKATPKRGRGVGSISGGRGSLTGQHVDDCDNPIRDNFVLSPKPLHLVIKR
jgi:hypothetical protein